MRLSFAVCYINLYQYIAVLRASEATHIRRPPTITAACFALVVIYPQFDDHAMLTRYIQDKLTNGEYNNLAQVESDCKRLVNNAKAYNDKKSLIYEDAERLRKTASNWMVKHNPAYRDGNYVAVATPVPGEDSSTPVKPIPRVASTPRAVHTPVASSDLTERPRRAAAVAHLGTPATSKLRHSASAALNDEEEDDDDDDDQGYTGKTFQQAQEQIVRDIIDYEE